MLNKAKAFAEKAHRGQTRKNSNTDYIVHPIRVAERLSEAGCSEAVISAGYLHDVVEDTSVNLEDLVREFGQEVARIVSAHTEDKSKSWQERKQHTIDTLRTAPKEVKCLIVADKLDNLLSLEEDLKRIGNDVWENFNAGKDHQRWYYESIAKEMDNNLSEAEIPLFFKEYTRTLYRVFT
ncbi:HD domain-containing protein [Halobacillus salinarum]|uniref:HD domain-containing protein n=1 Tax=Halobacillus salinarum TaxID=2932257 RepID=A0ABY4EK95_9BACI|nr:HD domain-containing protein [Halobacillus salinarum]UOQ44521.1 HD domain-containing protein [Halobacillus salinarum]